MQKIITIIKISTIHSSIGGYKHAKRIYETKHNQNFK